MNVEMKERWFNYRPLCLIFGFLLLGSVFAFYLLKELAFCITIALIIIFALVLLAIYKKKPQYALVPFIAFMLGVGMYYTAVARFDVGVNYTPTTIETRISNMSSERDGVIIVEGDTCAFDGKKQNDNITIYIYDNSGLFENIEIGNIIKFTPYKFYKSDLFYYDTPSASLYAKDLKYTASVLIEDVTFIKTDLTFAECIKEKIRNNLHIGLTNENAEIAYSALFGDKDLLSNKQYNVYKLSGVAHLLAVSGLHVGIIVGILNCILRWRKKKSWYKFFIVAFFLLFYAYLCDYSISIVRATIMSLVLMLATKTQREYDSFNSIAIAGIAVFCMNPLCIFDVGFLLSFSCVLGITMLYKPIKRVLRKTHMPKAIVESLAISMSTTISIVVIMAYYFKTLNIISIIANIILIPIFTVAFIVVFVLSILSLILPMITILLYPINYIFGFINMVATILGNLSISNFNTLEFNFIAILVYFVLLLFMGRFCTAKYQYKIITTLPMVALLFYCLL